MNGKTLKGRRECVFRDEVGNTDYCLRGINKPFTFTMPREDVLCALKELGLSMEILWFADHPYKSIQNGIKFKCKRK